MLGTLAAVLLALGSADKPKMVILDFRAGNGVPADVASALTEAATAQVARSGYFSTISSREVQTLLGLERQRQTMGCDTGAGSCLAELGGALGARFVMSGSVTRLGDAYQLSLQVMDSTTAQPLGRSTRLAKDLPTLLRQLPYALSEATASPRPPPPSRVLPYSVLGLGGLLVIGGAALGTDAISNERVISQELAQGDAGRIPLQSHASYAQAEDGAVNEKLYAVAAVAAGAIAIGLGIWLLPDDPQAGSIALVPSSSGFALAGAFP